MTTMDSLLTEVERQQKYLDRLPENFNYPLFNSMTALESQRRSGYRHTGSAAREIVDNAIEAGARRIDVVFELPQRRREKHQRKQSVTAVAFIDDGSGMLPQMARYALSWGGGTHFEEPNFIGKFGFGLPNASINQTKRVEVYTKTRSAKAVSMVHLDIRDYKSNPHSVQGIKPAVEAKLPDFVQRYLIAQGRTFDHGTIVVWCEPDRLSYRSAGALITHLMDEFGVAYRYLLREMAIYVDAKKVQATDPLFLNPEARYYRTPGDGGAILSMDPTLTVRYFRDPETNETRLERVEDSSELREHDESTLAVGTIAIRVVRFPIGFLEHGGRKAESEANKRFEIRKSRRGMSFVRANREIDTVDVFPRSMSDIASGMGRWPLLQGYAYHWGVEVRFPPELDEVFGITNDKQTVRPIEDFWRLLAREGIDAALSRENRWQADQRRKLEIPRAEPSDEPTPAERALARADVLIGRRPQVPDRDKAQLRQALEDAAVRRAGVTGRSVEEAKRAIEDETKRRPYRINFTDEQNGAFYEPVWEPAGQVVAHVNRLHPFYTALYGELLKLPGGRRAKEAVDVLLLALAKAEVTTDQDETKEFYEVQRRHVWSPFLANALKVLAQTAQPVEEEQASNGSEDYEEDNQAVKAA
ncbi:ATP-binding protein [Teichococcus vastitatis]|uniref:ATP-binding protein n=1 Tax=Teichococcus vastitatis TaxID=2307076 RepID=A0ABS9W9S2_9PROT|nr:ATP-binding protein [Pseudoroseomonas vastitatis]MCI0755738.1 ATP-binding protein [Pseudoroseomonas vastitatis]